MGAGDMVDIGELGGVAGVNTCWVVVERQGTSRTGNRRAGKRCLPGGRGDAEKVKPGGAGVTGNGEDDQNTG